MWNLRGKRFYRTVLILVFVLAFVVRFFNYENRITFGPEQAMSLTTSGRMVTEKFTLLGNQNLQRRTSDGHSLFAGALFNYSLIPLQLIFNYDPFPITVVFTLLNLFSGIVVYRLVKRMMDEKVALIMTILFLFHSWSIYHSMFIWNQNIMFLVGMVSIYLLHKFRNNDFRNVFYLGVLSGVGYTVQDLYLATAGLLIIYLLWKAKEKLRTLLLFIIGLAVPNLPAIVFDLRHDLYHIKTSIQFVLDSLGGNSGASLHSYHFLHFLPLALLLLAVLIMQVYEKRRIFAGIVLITFLYFNLSSSLIDFNSPTGMPAELTLKNIDRAAKVIADECPENFNVAVLIDFDTRGHILRYPLEFMYNKKPMDVISYPQSQTLYVLSENNYDFGNSQVWELSSFYRNETEELSRLSTNYSIYKLSK
jgi:hypothetical protein